MAHLLLVACVDFSPMTETVVARVQQLASATGARVVLVHAAAPEPDFVGYDRPGGPFDRSVREGELEHEAEQLDALVARLRAAGVEAERRLIQGPTVDVLLDEAEELGADLVVTGTHGRAFLHRFIVGSTTDGLIRRSPIPVVVVPSHES
jgi:nucleotide-binding universal stress UspA family protein